MKFAQKGTPANKLYRKKKLLRGWSKPKLFHLEFDIESKMQYPKLLVAKANRNLLTNKK